MLTYGQVLTSARDGSMFFDHTRISGGPAIRLASDIQRDLVSKLAKRDPERLATTATLTSATVVAALAVGNAPPLPVTIPAFMQVVRIQVRHASGVPHTLWAITPDEAEEHQRQPAWFLAGGSIYFTGTAEDWTDMTQVDVTYVPFVTDFTAETDSVILPDDAKWAFVARLQLAFALRVNGSPASQEADLSQTVSVDVNAFAEMAKSAEAAWLAQQSDQRRRMSRGTIRGEH